MQEATEYDANYWHTRYMLLKSKHNMLQQQLEETHVTLRMAYKHIMDEAEKRDFNPPVPTELVADIEHDLAQATGSEVA